MLNDAPGLGDTVAEWKPEFTQGRIHGVLFAAGDDAATVALEIGKGLEILGDAVTTVTNVEGLVRPDSHKGQEQYVHLWHQWTASQRNLDSRDTSTVLDSKMASLTRLLMGLIRRSSRARGRSNPGKPISPT